MEQQSEQKQQVEFVHYEVQRGFTEEVRSLFELAQKCGAIIAGGYVRYMANPDEESVLPADDFDMFTENDTAFNEITAYLRSDGYDLIKKTSFYQSFQKDTPLLRMLGKKSLLVQVIRSAISDDASTLTFNVDCKNPISLIDKFDFSCVRIALLSETETIGDKDFAFDELEHNINIKCIRSPLHIMKRVIKYSIKGYTYTMPEILKLFTYWNAKDDAYRQHLIKNITGLEHDYGPHPSATVEKR